MEEEKKLLPDGVRDFLPLEAKRKRMVESKIAATFERWGYREIITPTIEFFQAVSVGTSSQMQEKMIKFLDRRNRILSLRPDMTTPIARVVATRLKEEPHPLRLYYLANVFRSEEPRAGRQTEFYQAGIELIGASQAAADAETIAIAIECLKAVGISGFQVAMGQVDFLKGILEGCQLGDKAKGRVRHAINRRDLVELEEILGANSVSQVERETLLTIPGLYGKKEVLSQAAQLTINPKALQALANLKEVYELLELYGVDDYVKIDLGISRGLDYYTGVIFEVYAPWLGFPVGGGGRYDHLLGEFGTPCPATGFALGVEFILAALEKTARHEREGEGIAPDCFITYEPKDYPQAIAKANELRKRGLSVELEIMKRDRAASVAYARNKGIKRIIIVGENEHEEV